MHIYFIQNAHPKSKFVTNSNNFTPSNYSTSSNQSNSSANASALKSNNTKTADELSIDELLDVLDSSAMNSPIKKVDTKFSNVNSNTSKSSTFASTSNNSSNKRSWSETSNSTNYMDNAKQRYVYHLHMYIFIDYIFIYHVFNIYIDVVKQYYLVIVIIHEE